VIITDFPETAHTSSSSKTIRHVFFCFPPKTNFGVEIAPTNFDGVVRGTLQTVCRIRMKHGI